MLIEEVKWRKWLGLPYISVQGEWLEEFYQRKLNQGDVSSARWTGGFEEYRWAKPIRDWLQESGGRYKLEKCGQASDFAVGRQAKIWFRDMKNVTMFKLAWGGAKKPEDPPVVFGVTRTLVKAKSRKLKGTWSLQPPEKSTK